MTGRDARKVIETQAEMLAPSLYTGLAVSLAAARKRMTGLSHSRYPHALPLLTRMELREHLEREPLAKPHRQQSQHHDA